MNTRMDAIFGDQQVIDEQPKPVASTNGMERIMKSLQNFATISEALRILGAAVLLASMSIFLLQGWNEGNDIHRYLLLLTQTGLLAASGFALSHGLKETRGARLFFGLALVSIPANFTILSALIYSVFQWDGGLITYPGFATWSIGDVASIGITLGGAMLVLIPVTMFCFAIMARRSAITLSLHFLVINCLLLLPIRSSTAIGIVALLATTYALLVVGKLARVDGALKTPEGKFALMTLFIPGGIILFRSMYFYQVDSLLIAMLSIAVFLTARQASLFPDRKRGVALALDILSLPVALVAAVSLTTGLEQFVSWQFLAPIFAVTFALLAIDLIRRSDSNAVRASASVSISVLTCVSFVVNASSGSSLLTASMCLVAGIVMALAGHSFKHRTAFFAGVVTASAGVVFGLGEFVEMILHSSWVDLAIFGASAIALGSLLDRHGASLKLRMGKWLSELGRAHRESAEPLQSNIQLR